jgi:hypothetical protein
MSPKRNHYHHRDVVKHTRTHTHTKRTPYIYIYTSSLHGNSDVADPEKIMLFLTISLRERKKHLFAVVSCTRPSDMNDDDFCKSIAGHPLNY